MSHGHMQVTTQRCLFCSKTSEVQVSVDGYFKWQNGAFVQDAFPEMSAAERELLITGTHPDCWEENMKCEDDEDDACMECGEC